ncbi:MAG: hypothetical protein U0169_22095 [Polyangiaceae bacterium]
MRRPLFPWFLVAAFLGSSLATVGCLSTSVSPYAAAGDDDDTKTSRKKKASKADAGGVDGEEEDGEDGDDGDTPSTGSSSGTPSNGGTPRSGDAGPTGDAGSGSTVDSTRGTGGPTGPQELRSASGLSYQINAPATAGKPLGLLVLLHGSSASNYRQFVGMMEKVATANGLIRVSVLAPNGQGWNEGQQPAAAEKLHRLVQDDLFPKYDIDKSKVIFSGQSSGGGFLSTHFVPLYGKEYKGGALMQCGAAPPASTFTPDAAMKQNFRLHFEITTGDTIWPDSYRRAVDVYTQAGMALTKDDTKPGGHCQFDQQQVITDRIAFILGGR